MRLSCSAASLTLRPGSADTLDTSGCASSEGTWLKVTGPYARRLQHERRAAIGRSVRSGSDSLL